MTPLCGHTLPTLPLMSNINIGMTQCIYEHTHCWWSEMAFANAPTPSHWATRICNEISWGELTNQRPRDQAASESQRLAVKTATHGRRTGESEHSLHRPRTDVHQRAPFLSGMGASGRGSPRGPGPEHTMCTQPRGGTGG